MFFPAKCDFCSQRPVPWTYPAEDFEVTVSDNGRIVTLNSKEGWDACDTCHLLIEVDDWLGLAKRAQAADQPAVALSIYQQLHAAFRENRTGPAEPNS